MDSKVDKVDTKVDKAGHRPTIYLSNWASHKTAGHHGPGRKYTIMAAPRRWERGEGTVYHFVPMFESVRLVKAGVMPIDEYRKSFLVGLEGLDVRPGVLKAFPTEGLAEPVADGDTLCCACSRAEAAKGRCHRAWIAPMLAGQGWRVVLDGVELRGRPQHWADWSIMTAGGGRG